MEIDLGNSTIDPGNPEIIRDNVLTFQNNDDGALKPAPDARIKSPDELLQQVAPNKTQLMAKELADLREKYDREIAQWKEYEQRVHDWRKQVVQILQGSKKNSPDHQKLLAEVKALKTALHNKEEELKKLKTLLMQQTDDKKGFWTKLMAGGK